MKFMQLVKSGRQARGLALVILFAVSLVPASGQQHRAVRLGHPNTRFAPPLSRPDQLRALFQNPKLRNDVVEILRQARWTGDVEDLRRASLTAEIRELRLPKGSRLPFMSSRENGKPVALIDVLWDGDAPIEAYEFDFISRGRMVRCITPKPCSNFYVVDLGPVPPAVGLASLYPVTTTGCEPAKVDLYVTNSGLAKLTSVRLLETLPEGWSSQGAAGVLAWELGTLAPGEVKKVTYAASTGRPGRYRFKTEVTSTEAAARASGEVLVRVPQLRLQCVSRTETFIGRPAQLTLRLSNDGEATENRAVVMLQLPEDAVVSSTSPEGVRDGSKLTWEIGEVEPKDTREVVVTFTAEKSSTLNFQAAALGSCAGIIGAQCETRVMGIPAILLEVIDLEDPVELGKPVIYEIRVTNQGSLTDTGVELTCELDEGQTYISGSGPTPVVAEGRLLKFAPLAELRPKEAAVWRVTCTAAIAADARFRTRLSSGHITRPVEETEATRQY